MEDIAAKKAEVEGVERPKIVWMASYPKSGNTFLRCFLAAYRTGKLDINQTGAFSYDDMSRITYQSVLSKPIDECFPAEVVAARGAYLAAVLAPLKGNARVFMKTHNALCSLDEYPLIPEWFTEKALYVVRDPRDVAVSYSHHSGKTIDDTIEFLNKPDAMINHSTRFHSLGDWSTHVKSWTGKDTKIDRLFIRFEDMVERPKMTFGHVVNFLNWELNEERLDRAIELSSFDNLKAQEAEKGFAERMIADREFFRRGKVGAWREVLSDDQVARIEAAHGAVMKGIRYGCDSHDFGVSRSDRDSRYHG